MRLESTWQPLAAAEPFTGSSKHFVDPSLDAYSSLQPLFLDDRRSDERYVANLEGSVEVEGDPASAPKTRPPAPNARLQAVADTGCPLTRYRPENPDCLGEGHS